MKQKKFANKFLSGLIAISMLLTLVFPAFTVNAAVIPGKYVALGDSIPAGYAPEGLSVDSFVALINEREGIEATNLGVSGITSVALKETVVDSSAYDEDIADAEFITITIGGNDLMAVFYTLVAEKYNEGKVESEHIIAVQVAAKLAESDLATLAAALTVIDDGYDAVSAQFEAAGDVVKTNIQATINHIKSENSTAKIYVTNQYNPYKDMTFEFFGTTYNIGAFFESGVTNALNPKIQELTGCTIVDMYTQFNNATEKVTNAVMDGVAVNFDFHPNAAGHVLYATALSEIKAPDPVASNFKINNIALNNAATYDTTDNLGGALTSGTIEVSADGTTLTLTGATTTAGISASGDLKIVLVGENSIVGRDGEAGIAATNHSLTISGAGSITATGGYSEASGNTITVGKSGIDAKNITIESGSITAIGGNHHNIGNGKATGGYGIDVESMEVKSGTVAATGGKGSNYGNGSGDDGSGINANSISIDSGSVTAIGVYGFESESLQTSFTINGGEIIAASTEYYGYALDSAPTFGDTKKLVMQYSASYSGDIATGITPNEPTEVNGWDTNTSEYHRNSFVKITTAPFTISTQPIGASYNQNATAQALTVAMKYDTGVSYQWYKNTTNNTNNGEIILNGTSASFTPPTSETGTVYYYCVITEIGSSRAVTSDTATVTITSLSAQTDITGFTIPNQVEPSAIDTAKHTVDITMPYGTDVTALVPTIILSSGAHVNYTSGAAQDFTNAVTYTVEAEDGITTQDWTVTVTVLEKVATPTISPNGGSFDDAQSVTITATSGATIYYTTNGTEPTISSIKYIGAFEITESATVKAIAVKSGMVDSDVASATFTKNAPPLPTITNGANQTIVQGKGASFASNDDFENYIETLIYINGVPQVIHTAGNDTDNASAKSGSIIVTLSDEYTSSLAAGTYTIEIRSTNGEASAEFTVEAAPATDVPETGDSATPILYAVTVALALVGLGFTVKRKAAK